MDISGLSLKELRDLQDKVLKQIQISEQAEIAKARQEILAIAERTGLPLSDLVNTSSLKFKGQKAKAPVRYRHPETGDTWSGRGRQPMFVKDWLASGKPLEQLQVDAS